MLASIRAGLHWAYRSLFYDSSNTLSLGRAMMAFGLFNVWWMVWLGVGWVAYVTLTDRMEQAAPLANAIATVLSAVLSSQLVVIGAQYYTTKRLAGQGSVTAEQLEPPTAGPGGI